MMSIPFMHWSVAIFSSHFFFFFFFFSYFPEREGGKGRGDSLDLDKKGVKKE